MSVLNFNIIYNIIVLYKKRLYYLSLDSILLFYYYICKRLFTLIRR
jgi:hypothetical protein